MERGEKEPLDSPLAVHRGLWHGLLNLIFPLTSGSFSLTASGHGPVLCPLEVGTSEGNCAPHPRCKGLLSENSVPVGHMYPTLALLRPTVRAPSLGSESLFLCARQEL